MNFQANIHNILSLNILKTVKNMAISDTKYIKGFNLW